MSEIVFHQDVIEFSTRGHGWVTPLDERVAPIVARSGVVEGIVHLFNIGSTAAITTIEYEPGLVGDLAAVLNRLIPAGRDYGHEQAWHDGNAHSHLQAALVGPSLSIPLHDGRLLLGTWQQVVHVECDIRPRRRRVVVTVTGRKE